RRFDPALFIEERGEGGGIGHGRTVPRVPLNGAGGPPGIAGSAVRDTAAGRAWRSSVDSVARRRGGGGDGSGSLDGDHELLNGFGRLAVMGVEPADELVSAFLR